MKHAALIRESAAHRNKPKTTDLFTVNKHIDPMLKIYTCASINVLFIN